jgi:GPH family glycoside/pentoside/hexuronide:cation symporter
LLFICGFVTLSSVPVLAAKAHSMKESFKGLFASRLVRWALLIAFCNAIPTAITSTLFLFFTADVLQAPEQSGIMLAVYFLSAACAMPLWTCISAKRGKRTGLLIAMLMAIGCFIWAWFLGAGDTIAFYIICALSGMTLGADAALLPALFADVLSNMRTLGATAFGMWNFTSKLTMALAAGIALPTLALGGYEAGAHNAPHSLHMLSFCYALLPCMFKALAIVLLYISPLDRHSRVIRVVK